MPTGARSNATKVANNFAEWNMPGNEEARQYLGQVIVTAFYRYDNAS
jgi:hypothetical protein